MQPFDPTEGEHSISTQHLVLACVAGVISLIVHVVLVVFASNVRFFDSVGTSMRDRPARQYEAVRMVETIEEDGRQQRVLDALRQAVSDQQPGVLESVDELSQAPDPGLTEPLQATDDYLAGQDAGIIPSPSLPERGARDQQQEIVAIERRLVDVAPPTLSRKLIPAVERVPNAPDLVTPTSADMVDVLTSPEGSVFSTDTPPPAALSSGLLKGDAREPAQEAAWTPEGTAVLPDPGSELFEEKPEEITDIKPIERVLKASVASFVSRRDPDYRYFRLTIDRAGEELLPVIPKDFLFVQDCSASISEQRLYFCREGLRNSLSVLAPGDRFNVVRFKEGIETCFPDWQEPTDAARREAAAYINLMRSGGNTDLSRSMLELLSIKRTAGRPVIAMVITDGLANTGVTDSSAIIGEFSRQNDGAISVFTLGTVQTANTYLLDLISYCNRGTVKTVTKGRWEIGEAAAAFADSVSRPVLGNLRFRFADEERSEVYPVQTSNLYLDRPLQLFGRCRKDVDQVVFQAVGEFGPMKCDLLFVLPLDEQSVTEDEEIRSHWARQKIYHLIGAYARTEDEATYMELRKTARDYGEDIPHRKRLRKK